MRVFLLRLMPVLLIGFAVSRPAHAAGTASGTASAAIVAPLILTHNSGTSLNFGIFSAGSGGTVVVTTAGAGSTTSGVALMSNATTAADSFSVIGDKVRLFNVASGSGVVTNGAATMSFTTVPLAVILTTGTFGTDTFKIGGTLTVPGGTTPGSYSGTYTVTVTYN